ncbi:MAG: hypothetical protein MAG794_00559 [Gammaproteobacteria bacterium]|nr:hypothetical protein [Gammaproteobacteria bacterium]
MFARAGTGCPLFEYMGDAMVCLTGIDDSILAGGAPENARIAGLAATRGVEDSPIQKHPIAVHCFHLGFASREVTVFSEKFFGHDSSMVGNDEVSN